jgi:hypothetical protein
MSTPVWTEKYRDPQLSTPIALNPLQGLACERGDNAPTRDEQFFPIVVAQRPIFELPTPVAMESESVPQVYTSQVKGSSGFDVGYDEVWVNNDYVMQCTGRQ